MNRIPLAFLKTLSNRLLSRSQQHLNIFNFQFLSTIFQLQIYLVTSGGESNAISCGIGPEETGSGKQHWIDILHNPRKPIAMWHYLR